MTQAPSGNWKELQKTIGTTSNKSNKRKLRHDYLAKQTSGSPGPPTTPEDTSRTYKKRKELVASGEITDLDLKMAYGSRQDGDGRGGVGVSSTLSNLLDDSGLTASQRLPGRYLAIDCEMVGVGYKGSQSVLARVSLVNFHGAVLLDRYVRPKEAVTDWRTWISGITPEIMRREGVEFEQVQKEVADLIKDKILIGHAIRNDLSALLLTHPHSLIRDTATYSGAHRLLGTKSPSLKRLAKECLDIDFQAGRHDSVDDAKVTMLVYRHFKKDWEAARGRGT